MVINNTKNKLIIRSELISGIKARFFYKKEKTQIEQCIDK